MSEIDLESQVSSEDEVLGSEKLVPVGEAIRYHRKRAQNAEKRADEFRERLQATTEKNEQLARQLKDVELNQKLVERLTTAGACDLEAAVLVAKARMESSGDADVESVVEQLRKEKSYLFEDLEVGVMASKTAGVKERKSGARRMLEKAAKRAAVSGSRADVQEYLRVRRQFV